jgi:tetratricopeptide (TPR) repeat protein
MSNPSHELEDRIQRLLDEGDERLNEDHPEESIALYESAWELLPEPRTAQPYALHVLAAIGDARFQRGDFAAGRDAFMMAMRCAYGEPLGNPYLRLRLGQCMYELGELREAANWLAGAYLSEGTRIFAEADSKYLEFIKSQLKPPPGGWPGGW